MALPYERPQIKDLGSLQALTQQNKDFGGNDGFTFQNIPVGNAS